MNLKQVEHMVFLFIVLFGEQNFTKIYMFSLNVNSVLK